MALKLATEGSTVVCSDINEQTAQATAARAEEAGAKAVANAETHIVCGADFANVIPVGVKEIFLVMREAPLGHDGATAADDAGHALGCERHKPQQDTGVDLSLIHI